MTARTPHMLTEGGTGRKSRGPRITPQRYDAIAAALRKTPDDIKAIAARFDLGTGVVTRLRGTIRRWGG